jgi:hypothetical protein
MSFAACAIEAPTALVPPDTIASDSNRVTLEDQSQAACV